MKAIRIHEYGGPEVLTYEDVSLPEPGVGEARLRMEAVGVNYIDTYHRSGLYPSNLPFTPGMEGAGVIDELGPGETRFRTGDRVAYCMVRGSYADYSIVPLNLLVPLPEGTDTKLGAAALLQGMTAHYLVHSTYPVKEGDVMLLHAAGGATGLLVTQMAKRLGATVYGTASTDEKLELAKEAGADEVIPYTRVDFEDEIKRLTDRKGVDVVFDSVGKTTFEKSLACLKPRGMLVFFGQASGAVPTFSPTLLAPKSLYLTRPMLGDHVRERSDLERRANDLFSWIADGSLKIRIGGEFPLADAPEAHRRLQDRARVGKLVLIP